MSDGAFFVGPIDDPRRYRVNAEQADNPLDGGEGLVYQAVDCRSGERVALKMLTTARADDHARIVSRLLPFIEIDHPNVMRQRDVFLGAALAHHPPDDPIEYENIYTVADWIDGEPLSRAGLGDNWRSAFIGLGGLARGLGALAAHRSDLTPRGLVHRDVKPSNVRLSSDGQLVLIDLGVARPLDDNDLTAGVGTYRWRAPEVLSGAAPTTSATDAWGLGAIAYWLLVGEPPGLEGAAAARERILSAERTREFHDPAAIATHIAQLLETSPTDRPNDLNKWAQQLRATAVSPKKRRALGPLVIALLGAAAIGGLTMAGVLLLLGGDDSTVAVERGETAGETSSNDAPNDLEDNTDPISQESTIGESTATSLADEPNQMAAPETLLPLEPVAPQVPAVPLPMDPPSPPTTWPLPVVESITASTQRPFSTDACENPVTYEPEQLVDGDRGTAWMAEGDGTGQTIHINLSARSNVREIGLIPGYDKIDPCSGADRFNDLRKVTSVRWAFDDGSSVIQNFSPSRQLQMISLGSGVVTSTIRITILGTSPPGLERLNHTPISEVVIR